jgi:hypothetical protein
LYACRAFAQFPEDQSAVVRGELIMRLSGVQMLLLAATSLIGLAIIATAMPG